LPRLTAPVQAAAVPPLSSTLASQRWIARTWRGFFAATGVRLSQRSTTPCVTDRCYGRADGRHRSFPVTAWSRLERHQNTDLSDPHPASGVRAGIESARLSLPALGVYAGL